MSEILSQEQIDSLLSQKDLTDTALSSGEPGSDLLGAAVKDYDALRKAFEIFNEQAGGTISTIFNKNTVFETLLCDKTEAPLVAENLVAPLLQLEIPFRSLRKRGGVELSVKCQAKCRGKKGF